jgi:nucleotide-binding universal stress UspA family protein
MSIKDVVVCLDPTEAGERRLKLAADLAHRHKAHLTAAYLLSDLGTEPDIVYGPGAIGIGITTPVAARAGEGAVAAGPDGEPGVSRRVARAELVEQRFREALHLHGGPGEWHLFDRGETEGLIALAKGNDLVIVGQHQPDARASAEFRPERIVVACGRPLLVVPYAGNFAAIGKHVLIAWDGSREAVRAVHDALPLMVDAAAVTVITISHSARQIERAHTSVDRIVHHLARHGLPVRAEESSQGELAISDLLLSRASDLSADLIIAGAYHHSRFREALIGGVSQDLLQHMTVPVLMSH